MRNLKEKVKNALLGQQWLIGLSNAAFVVAGFAAGRDEPLLSVSLGVLATGILAIQYNMAKKHELKTAADAYATGLNHSQRRTNMRR